ncbi:unnamed protein product [Meganyctiphanes norvegica]|uniref:Uncharacterized protein n=1 Tax=Meganyctiphanes norvegica TaxID=48144 RepID=A0AAV2S7A5_MEGNR
MLKQGRGDGAVLSLGLSKQNKKAFKHLCPLGKHFSCAIFMPHMIIVGLKERAYICGGNDSFVNISDTIDKVLSILAMYEATPRDAYHYTTKASKLIYISSRK